MTARESQATAYATLVADHAHELEVRRSRFIAYLFRTDTEDAARAALAGLRRQHHDARHHCTAFILGADRQIQRSNDDGEPSGTAGVPMLEALARRETPSGQTDLSDITAVVVRYFGGILLGAGGLVRAYSQSVSSALDGARLIRRQRMALLGIESSPADAGRLEHELRAQGITVRGTEYGPDLATLQIALPDAPDAVSAFGARLAALTSGSATAVPRGSAWVDTPFGTAP